VNAARRDDGHVSVTEAKCEARHKGTNWAIVSLGTLLVGILFAVLLAIDRANDARAATVTLEAVVQERQRSWDESLAIIRQDLQDIKQALRTRP